MLRTESFYGTTNITQLAVAPIESEPLWHSLSLRGVAVPTYLDCVAEVAAELRHAAKAELIDIAYWSRASQGAVSRFENSHSQPRDLDRLLLAYSKVCGVPAADILRQAIDRWEAAGGGELPVSPFPGGALLPEGGEIEQRGRAASPRKRAPARRRSGGEG